MYTKVQPLVPIEEAAAKDEALQKAMEKVQAGEIVATAPCDAVFNQWPEAEKKKLVKVMRELFHA